MVEINSDRVSPYQEREVKLDQKERAGLACLAVCITIFTLGLGLAFSAIRDLWKKVLTGKKIERLSLDGNLPIHSIATRVDQVAAYSPNFISGERSSQKNFEKGNLIKTGNKSCFFQIEEVNSTVKQTNQRRTNDIIGFTSNDRNWEERLESWKNDPNVTGNKTLAFEKIKKAIENQDRKLNLEGLHLSALPPVFDQLIQLEKLNLSYNQINSLPVEIGRLVQLGELYLVNNQFTTLPEEIGQLVQLKKLDLDSNHLTTLSGKIGKLVQLEELNLSCNQLTSLPAEIGQLVQLKSLHLSTNQLTTLPLEIGRLVQLEKVNLTGNDLTNLPAEIRLLAQLKTLFLGNNQLTTLPVEIGQLTQLVAIFLEGNQINNLPVEIGQLIHLQFLYLENNEFLTELPLTLGEVALFELNCDGTAIPGALQQAVLERCRAKRDQEDALLPRLKSWFAIANGVFPDSMPQLSEQHQNTLNEWLRRLERTKDYHHCQKSLALYVCQMLTTVIEDETFREMFMNQAEANNANCQDRSAMAMNEIYTSWKIHTLPKDAPLKVKVELLVQAAKTLALRRLLDDLIHQQEKKTGHHEQESVEIFLYYEIRLKETLGLLSLIQNMAYAQIGKRNWINESELQQQVNETFYHDLNQIQAFTCILEEDLNYQNLKKTLEEKIYQKLEEILNNPHLKPEERERASRDLMEEKNQAEIESIKAWTSQVLQM